MPYHSILQKNKLFDIVLYHILLTLVISKINNYLIDNIKQFYNQFRPHKHQQHQLQQHQLQRHQLQQRQHQHQLQQQLQQQQQKLQQHQLQQHQLQQHQLQLQLKNQ